MIPLHSYSEINNNYEDILEIDNLSSIFEETKMHKMENILIKINHGRKYIKEKVQII